MKLSKQQKEKIEKWAAEAKKRMRLEHWEIKFFYNEKVEGLMEVRNNVEYLRALIFVNEQAMIDEWRLGDAVMRQHVYHEVVHILLARFLHVASSRCVSDSEFKEVQESTTEHIARLLV